MQHERDGGNVIVGHLPRVGRACAATLSALLLATQAFAGAPSPRPEAAGPHTPEHQVASLGSFRFESGETINDLKVSYVTYGKLNAARDNAVLSLQHFAGDHHDNEFLIGPGKALDTEKYFIIATDFLANAKLRQDLTTGPTNSGLKMHFPRITARDWVNADYKLVKEYMGIEHLVAAVGYSIGGQNALQLGVSYPDYASSIIAIGATARTNPQTQLVFRAFRAAIEHDPAWYSGTYEVNPVSACAALKILVPWYNSPEWYVENLTTREKVRDYEKLWDKICIAADVDVRDIYYQSFGYSDFNIGDTPGFNGDPKAALATIRVKTLLIAIKQDQIFRREEMVYASEEIPNAAYVEISAPTGHLAGGGGWDAKADEAMNREIAKFLSTLK